MMASGWALPDTTHPGGDSPAEPSGPCLVLWNGMAKSGVALRGPVARITGTSKLLEAEGWGEQKRWEGNPLDHLDEAFAWVAGEARCRGLHAACFGGAFHYDLRRCVERYPSPAQDELGLPWIRWFLFSRVSSWSLAGEAQPAAALPSNISAGASSLSREAFEGAVRRILRHEVEGDVYQVNLTRQVELLHEGPAFDLWHAAVVASPAPFAACADLDGFQLLSLSPERFLLRRGETLLTQPIKGTATRGATQADDAANLSCLLAGEKEAAELAMIVDVERNDLGRVSVPGSVGVEGHREVITLPNVHHLASTVKATLRPGVGLAEILRATFPGGSVTGAPKIRAMQIIDALEPVSRGYYCGALGWMDLEGDFDLSLTIRTATACEGSVRLGVGGGIVVDSHPGAEWLETVAKAKCFLGD
jgi:anthranilate/para-aminobenzoate synthase component I